MGWTKEPIGRPLRWWEGVFIVFGVMIFFLMAGTGLMLFLQTVMNL